VGWEEHTTYEYIVCQNGGGGGNVSQAYQACGKTSGVQMSFKCEKYCRNSGEIRHG